MLTSTISFTGADPVGGAPGAHPPKIGNNLHFFIKWGSLSVTCVRSVVFSGYSGFLHQYNWPPRYHWNIVESGVKGPFFLSAPPNLKSWIRLCFMWPYLYMCSFKLHVLRLYKHKYKFFFFFFFFFFKLLPIMINHVLPINFTWVVLAC
jgi:hypothetical protein